MKRVVCCAAASALLCLLAAAFAGGQVEKRKDKEKDGVDDAAFVKQAASANQAEIEAAELALKEASSRDLRRLAQEIVKDHKNAQIELERSARYAGIEMPKTMLPEHEAAGRALAKHKGTEGFDAAFAKHLVASHVRNVELYEKASVSLKGAALRKYVDRKLPILRTHLEAARGLARESKDEKTKEKPSR